MSPLLLIKFLLENLGCSACIRYICQLHSWIRLINPVIIISNDGPTQISPQDRASRPKMIHGKSWQEHILSIDRQILNLRYLNHLEEKWEERTKLFLPRPSPILSNQITRHLGGWGEWRREKNTEHYSNAAISDFLI